MIQTKQDGANEMFWIGFRITNFNKINVAQCPVGL